MSGGRGYMPVADRHDWQTPPELFDALWNEFGPFTLDPCTEPGQAIALRILGAGGRAFCPPWITAPTTQWREDGLTRSWSGRVFLNPPHKNVAKWVEKAHNEVERGNADLVCALLPARTDTRWFQTYVMREAKRSDLERAIIEDRIRFEKDSGGFVGPAAFVRFLPGRVRFVGAEHPAPFPSVIVVWRNGTDARG